MATNMLQPTRMIGGQRFNVRRMNNYLGADYILVVDVTPDQLTTLGAPDQSNTYLRCNGKTYRWLNGAWVDFFPVGDGAVGPAGMSAYQLAVSRGYVGSIDEWIASLKGDPGRMGVQGDKGNDGPPNTLTIGTVASGTNAAATISGASPNQKLNLTLPKGVDGNAGPANSLSIGTVTTVPTGQPATAAISGTPPNQTLDLGLPVGATGAGVKGDKGDTGTAGTASNLTIGTVTSVPSGSPATASITGTAPNQKLNLGLPMGATGNNGSDGATPTLSIGTVTTLAAGAQATASISSGKISLGIPAGANGAAGSLAIGTVTTLSAGTSATAAIVDGKLNLGIPGSKRIDTYTGTTDANGLYTVTFPTAFAATPSIQPEPPLVGSQVWVKVSSSATGFSLRLMQRNSATVLGLELLLAAMVNVSGAPARVTVIEA